MKNFKDTKADTKVDMKAIKAHNKKIAKKGK